MIKQNEHNPLKVYKVYKDYCAVKAHYNTSKYNYIERNGHTTAKVSSFEKRQDKHFFEKLARKKEYFDYLVANIAYTDSWIGDIALNTESDENYITFKKRKQSLKYHVKRDLKKLTPTIKDCIIVKNEHPLVLKKYIEGKISLETISILTNTLDIIPFWDQNMEDDILWTGSREKIRKHASFLTWKKSDYLKIIIDIQEEMVYK